MASDYHGGSVQHAKNCIRFRRSRVPDRVRVIGGSTAAPHKGKRYALGCLVSVEG
jgi:hypothetical protein